MYFVERGIIIFWEEEQHFILATMGAASFFAGDYFITIWNTESKKDIADSGFYDSKYEKILLLLTILEPAQNTPVDLGVAKFDGISELISI